MASNVLRDSSRGRQLWLSVLLLVVVLASSSCIQPASMSGDVYQCPESLLRENKELLQELKQGLEEWQKQNNKFQA